MNNKNYNSKQRILVFCTDSDINDPTVKKLATQMGTLTSVNDEYNEQSLSYVLENLFGFHKGNYEKELIEGGQRTRFGKTVEGEHRYIGSERLDKEWCTSSMASQEAKEVFKFGEVL